MNCAGTPPPGRPQDRIKKGGWIAETFRISELFEIRAPARILHYDANMR